MKKSRKVRKSSNASSVSDPTRVVGASGAVITDGYVVEDESNGSLTGGNQYITYSNLLANTSIVAAGVRYFLNLVAKPTWKTVPPDQENELAVYYAKIVNKQKDRMATSWSRAIRRSAMYRFYGFSIQEWTMELADGIYQYKDIAPRPQSTIEKWDIDNEGQVTGIHQRLVNTGFLQPIPREKIIYLVDDSLNDSPQGLGLFRHIVSACSRLQRYEQLEGYGFESDLRGIPVGRAPFAAMQEAVNSGLLTSADKKAAEAPLLRFIENHIKNPALGILVDSMTYQTLDDASTPSSVKQWDIELLKGSSSALPDMAVAIERVNREIARILGVEGLLLGEQTTGSHALSSDKALNFALIVDSTLSEIVDTYQKDFIKRLFEMNGWDQNLMPTFEVDVMQHRDITQVTQALKDLADAGAMLDPNDPATNEVRALLGVSPQPVIDAEEARRRVEANTRGKETGSKDKPVEPVQKPEPTSSKRRKV
jgi:hypothetical protein